MPSRVAFVVHSVDGFLFPCLYVSPNTCSFRDVKIVLKSASTHTFNAGPFPIVSKNNYFRRSKTQTWKAENERERSGWLK